MQHEIKSVGGIWLPAHDQHLGKWMLDRNEQVDGRLTYQYHKLTEALKHVKFFRCAVDIGAHVGLWSMHLAKRFVEVQAFEPIGLHRHCFNLNVDSDNVELSAVALGEVAGSIAMHTTPGSSGDSWVKGDGDIPLVTLDSLELTAVDFIKLDCEGYELFALRGGRATIERWRPAICVEQKPGKAKQFGLKDTEAVDFLKGLGYALAREMGGDYIMVYKGAA